MNYRLKSVVTIALLFLVLNCSTNTELSRIEGFWEGEFMPGNDFTLILTFEEKIDEFEGRVILYQGDQQIQNDLLSKIKLNDGQISFYIQTKDTRFNGIINPENETIDGNFKFPDGTLHHLMVNKVEKPSLGLFAPHKSSESNLNALELVFSVDQLQEDFKYLREQLESTHPQLYHYTAKKSFNSIFDMTYNAIDKGMTEDAFFKMLSPIIANVRCVHTGIRHSDKYDEAIKSEKHLIPLGIFIENGEAYVTNNYSNNNRIELGAKIIAINDIPMSEIISDLKYNISSDGYNETHKIQELNDNFPYYYSIYIENCELLKIDVIQPSGDNIVLNVNAQDNQSQNESLIQGHLERVNNEKLPYKIELINNSITALLTIKEFHSPEIELYTQFLSETFNMLRTKNTRNLIIDVRGNKGGHPLFAVELLTYIAKNSFTYFKQSEGHNDFETLYSPISVKNDRFNGDIYVIMDGNCLSTTGHFLSLVKYHDMATLIGEESGGSFYCNDGSIQLVLPNSGIKVNLPQMTFQTAVTGFNQGDQIEPDIHVRNSVDDKIGNRDSVLDFLNQLLN